VAGDPPQGQDLNYKESEAGSADPRDPEAGLLHCQALSAVC